MTVPNQPILTGLNWNRRLRIEDKTCTLCNLSCRHLMQRNTTFSV